MSRKSLDEIMRFLQPLTKGEGIAAQEFKVPEMVQKKWPTLDDFKEILIKRFQQERPSDRRTSKVTLYEHLRSLGALDAILSTAVIEQIQCHLELFEIEDRLRILDHDQRSTRNYPVEFHRSVVRAIYEHILKLHELSERYNVEKDWLKTYESSGHRQMVRELRALFPLYPFGTTRGHLTKTATSCDELIYTVHSIVSEALKHAGVVKGHVELSLKLTAMFCSRSDFFSSGFSTEAVRARLKRRSRSRSNSSSIHS